MVLVLNTLDVYFLAKFLQAFLFGVYSGVFALYLYYTTEKRDNTKIFFYSLSALYILSGAVLVVNVFKTVYGVFVPSILAYLPIQFRFSVLEPVIFGCCDFIAQSILIYRCWHVWNRCIGSSFEPSFKIRVRVVIILIILALAYLALWMASVGGTYIEGNGVYSTVWSTNGFTAGIVMSLVLNALVTGLIAFRIYMVVKDDSPFSESKVKFRYVMFTVIESGMVLFSIQLARAVVTALRIGGVGGSESTLKAFDIIVNCHEMLNGIIPTIILVRVSMGLSFGDETSCRDAVHSLRFANPKSRKNDSSISDHDDSDIHMSEGLSASETIDKSMDSKDGYIHKEGDSVELV